MSALTPGASVTELRNMVQFGPTDEDNYIFCPRKDRKFVFMSRASSGRGRLSVGTLERADASTSSKHSFVGRA